MFSKQQGLFNVSKKGARDMYFWDYHKIKQYFSQFELIMSVCVCVFVFLLSRTCLFPFDCSFNCHHQGEVFQNIDFCVKFVSIQCNRLGLLGQCQIKT